MSYLSEAYDATRWDGKSNEELFNMGVEPKSLDKKLWNTYREVH